MKKMKKFFAILMAMIMVMGMSMTALAQKQEPGAPPRSTDTVDIKIGGLDETAPDGTTIVPKVTLYKIIGAQYGDGGLEFKDYCMTATDEEGKALTDITVNDFVNQPSETYSKPTSDTIAKMANGISSGKILAEKVCENQTPGTNGQFSYNVPAGAYIAIITGGGAGTVYNPIFLTAAYGSATAEGGAENSNAGMLIGGEISANSNYLYGATAVAKKTTAGIKKEITDGATEDSTHQDEEKKNIKTASIGDVLEYTLTPTVPTYPKDAVNKTFYISDTMVAGLTLDFSSITIKIGTDSVTGVKGGDGVASFTYQNRVIAKAKETNANGQHGFNLAFDYDQLIVDQTANSTGTIYSPITVTYEAIINSGAVVGGPTGNTNDVTLYYANQPNSGKSYKDPDPSHPDENPVGGAGIDTDTDRETVYTYRLAFLKTDDTAANPKGLGGAVFGIYKNYTPATEDQEAEYTGLVDVVTTNSTGYAESTNVAAGTYYLKELVAPKGYSLLVPETPITVTVNWTSATTTTNSTVTNFDYTTNAAESLDGTQAGWLKKETPESTTGTFYALSAFTEGTGENEGRYGVKDEDGKFTEVSGVVPAYIKSANTTTTTRTETVTNTAGTQGTGVFYLTSAIQNTKLNALPSTGGIGTTIFTIGGCAIMILAAGLYFASRRKSAK